jgi:hypothetical protein
MTQYFGYAVDRRYLLLLLPFGFKRGRDGVTLGDDTFEATFGFFKVSTSRRNITGAHITRNYRWWTAFGVRGSMADDGLSFGSNYSAGVCIHFADKVPSRLRKSGHSALTVTVEDLAGLTRALGGDPDLTPRPAGRRVVRRRVSGGLSLWTGPSLIGYGTRQLC